jgi:hypothetical protein
MTTTFVLAVSHRETGRDLARTVEDMWGACQLTLRRQLTDDVHELRSGRVSLALTPELGARVHRRVAGCLEGPFERVQADVVKSSTGPT